MLRRLHVQGYKTLRDVDLALGPLNVLIGPNGCGKTNLLDVIALLHEYAAGKLEDAIYARGGLDGILWARGEYESIRTRLVFDVDSHGKETDWEFRLQLRKSGTALVSDTALGRADKLRLAQDVAPAPYKTSIWPPPVRKTHAPRTQVDEATEQLDDLLAGSIIYTFLDTTPGAPMRQPALIRPQTRLVNGGDNLVNVLYHLSSARQYRRAYQEILDDIQTAYHDFEELAFPAEGGDGRIVMRWKEQSFQRDFSAHYLSDGVLRFLCLLVILKTPDPPPLICIDEPESGLHPGLMPIVADLLRDAANRTQLVVATHSPQLVDALDVEHIVVMEKVDGETLVQRLQDRSQFDAWLEHYTKAELWLSGELGEVL